LQRDLSGKSEALTNILNPRNPIPPGPPVKYPGHNLYSFRKEDLANAHEEYENELEKRVMKFRHKKYKYNNASHNADIEYHAVL